jgi:hypothetical protein
MESVRASCRASAVVAIAALVLLMGCAGAGNEPPRRAEAADATGGSAGDRADAGSQTDSAALATPEPSGQAPPHVNPCTVRTSLGDRVVSREAARALTSLAAAATREVTAETDLALAYDRIVAGALTDAEAVALAAALSGREPAALTCEVARMDLPAEPLEPSGLTARGEALRARILATFGPLPMGGFAPGGVDSGHVDDSSHYDGRAIDIFFRPITPEGTALGWVLAHWLVAHGDDTTLLSVIYADRIWTSWASCAGWRDYVHPGGVTDNPVLRHLDHVHTAVQGPRRVLTAEELAERAARAPRC